MIGFPLALNTDQTAKVIAPAIITGSCLQLLGTSPDVTVDYVGPILLPAGDFHAPGSYISYVNAGGSWIGTAELVDFGGNVIATATIDGSGTGFIHVPFDANVNIPSDTLCYLRFTNTDSGAGVISYYLEVVRAGALPSIVTPPTLTWTVEIGNSPTLTDPVVTGSFTHITWTLYRDGVADGTIVGVSKATAEAYTAVAADIGPSLHFEATVTNGSGSDSEVTNTTVFDDAAYLPDTAIGVSTAGLTLADSDTTVDSWAATLGGLAATLTAPTAGQRPAYSASAGVGGRPLVTGDGAGDVLTGTVTKGSAWSTGELGLVGACLTALSSRMARWSANTLLFSTNTTNHFRARWSNGTVSSTSAALTNGHWSLDAVSGGTQSLRQSGTVLVTGSAGAANESDGSTFAVFGDGAGATTNVAMQAWYLGPQLTADQRTHLRALLTYHTGVAC